MKKNRFVPILLCALMVFILPAQVTADDTVSGSAANVDMDSIIVEADSIATAPEGWNGKTDADYSKDDAVPVQGLDAPSEIVPYASTSGEWIQSSNGKWWYQYSDGTYPANGWAYIDGYWYYFDADGWMKTGWLTLNGKTYYLGTSGAMAIGWRQIGSSWYYFWSGGSMATGWQYLEYSGGEAWFYFGTSGKMATGWKTINGEQYYFLSSGVMVTGWNQIGGTWYYFNSSGIYVADDGSEYHGYVGVYISGSYKGISASIKMPSTLPIIAGSGESAWVSTEKDADGHWVQAGARYWSGYSGFKTYVEYGSGNTSKKTELGVHQLSTTIPYKVEYSSSDGKWHAYVADVDKMSSALASSTLDVEAFGEIHKQNIEMGPFVFSSVKVKNSGGSWVNNTTAPSSRITSYTVTGTATSFTVSGPT